MKSPRTLILLLGLVLAGFIGVRVIPMKGLIGSGGALEVLMLLRQLGLGIPVEYLVQVVLFVLLSVAGVVLFIRLMAAVTARHLPRSEELMERLLAAAGGSNRSLFLSGGLLLRLLIAGACILIVVLGVRKWAPLDDSALRVVSVQPHLELRADNLPDVALATLQLADNNDANYVIKAARFVRDLNRGRPTVIVLPMRGGGDADTSEARKYLNSVPNVLQYNVPYSTRYLNSPLSARDSFGTGMPVATSHEVNQETRGWPPLLEWRPLSVSRISSGAETAGILLEVALAAALRAEGSQNLLRLEQGDHEYRIGSRTIPVGEDGRTYSIVDYPYVYGSGILAHEGEDHRLRYYNSAGDADTLSAIYLDRIRGKIVFINYQDAGYVPGGGPGFRPWEYASLTQSILRNSMVRRADGLEIACICVVIFLSVVLYRFTPFLAALAGTLVVGLACAGIAIALARSSGILLQSYYFPASALLCATLLSFVRASYFAGRRRRIRDDH